VKRHTAFQLQLRKKVEVYARIFILLKVEMYAIFSTSKALLATISFENKYK
jgi:hypothetical protein